MDDNARMREMIRSIVSTVDAEVYEAADGAEGVRMHDELKPQWVLMDVQMGPEDGISATRRIRASDPNARVIIVTDFDDADTREAAQAAGACELVSKESLPRLLEILTGATAPKPKRVG